MDDEEEKRAEARRADGACLAISRDEAEIYFPKKDIKNDDCDAVICGGAYREGKGAAF